MNFRKNYQREMNEIEKPANITEQVLYAADMEQETYTDKTNRSVPKSIATWKTAVATIAIACVLCLCLQQEKVIAFAQSVLNRLTVLSVNNENIEFDKIEPVKINMEGFLKGELPASEAVPYYRLFSSYQQMNQLTQLELPCADKVEYRELAMDITPRTQTGRVSAVILYKNVSYNIYGMFKLDNFDEEEWEEGWGFGEEGTKEVYQYGDGKSACFVKDLDGIDRVYFVEENIFFQMTFNTSNNIELGATANKKQTKNLLKLFGER